MASMAVSEAKISPKGEELLHYVRKGRVKEATMLLVNGADPNVQDPETGNTALHFAASIKNQVLVKLMIVFDADLTLKNHQNQTALDLAREEGAADVAKDISTILDLQKELNADEHRVLRSAKRDADEVLLLSLDGGGIRGLVFIQVMLEIEKRKMTLYPDARQPLLSQFNWMTGNSAGGLAALALAGSSVDAKYGRKLFFTVKDEVLGGKPPIPNKRVDKVFEKVFGDIYGPSAMMSDIKGRNVSVMTTLCSQSPPLLQIMSNYGGLRHKGTDPPEKQLIWKAARATSSVPVFFHPQDEVYLDGGLIANNPTTDGIIDMYDHAKKENKKVEFKFVLSLGTGCEAPEAIDDVDFAPSRMGKFLAKVANLFGMQKIGEDVDVSLTVAHNPKAFKQLLGVISAQIIQPNGQVLRRAEFISDQLGAEYHRINPTIPSIGYLATDDAQLIEMLYSVMKYMLENCCQQIDPVLDYLYGK